MNRYDGNTGRFVHVPEHGSTFSRPSAETRVPADRQELGAGKTPSQSGILGGLGNILSKISKPNIEMEDLILVGVFYLLYRESGDIEFLLIAGAMLFL
jgi:hypothetical protein